jgi:hypothetical protein
VLIAIHRFLFLGHGCDIDDKLVKPLFPNLQVRVGTLSHRRKNSADDFGAADEVDIAIYRPISTSCVFLHPLRTPMRRRMMGDISSLPEFLRESVRNSWLNDYLPLPLPMKNIVLDDTGSLQDDISWDIRGVAAPNTLVQRPPYRSFYQGTIVLKHQNSHSTQQLPPSHGNPVPAANIVTSLFQLLRLAASSEKTFPNDLETQYYKDIDIPQGLYQGGPCIRVHLGRADLVDLVERVS